MIQRQIVARGVVDPLVIKAIENVPRHRFVDERLEKLAYDDSPLPIGDNQTISQPFIVAYMTAALELKGGEKVLEVGTGSGYQAAVLAELADQVYTIEVNENLAIEVAGRLKKLGYYNVSLKCDNGYQGWPEYAPFDGIIVTAAPDHIPEPLLEQLKPGKKMIIPVGQASQELLVVSKQSDGSIRKEARIAVRFVPMIDETENRD
ncbi:protein-L-isoaspartate(D-aspartate) O-methyltransferase [candidate division KSB1 bacterium]|nr:protein-L-isoaspartate(D-aspartate) O-methyltransferase [candidate division KSB1 bacterium]NIR72833.1 protein-L-isoaspartate(D-aspartate) O-methyltransferase [candidate division KSB1 bacterium]NIS26873.1 protein-L-isoaspartate(D-aspartate) O-methyltransferase [candidate division KSB1 bacterium]NIT73669.1 protein-L-isoaspartate(D-aspartate) O-methyltransferase [candidate division KSB1 bacterium]NIU27540.1 protein-L-isoaspartate(D-aspartate) O-methyltransferase [candidate division KSB1 bacteri